MKNSTTKLFVALFLLSFSFSSFASDEKRMDELFERLATVKVNFDPAGTVCEQVALIEFEERFPKDKYDMTVSIEYGNKEAIGELDVVVFDKKTKIVDTIAEVKCWKSMEGGLKKARSQRMRFQAGVKRNIKLWDKNKTQYQRSQFENVREYLTVGQKGALEHGYDVELSLDLKDLMRLRDRMLDCYSEKKCPRLP